MVEAQGTGDLDAAAKAAVVCAQKHLPKPIWAVVASRSGTDGEALAKSVAGVDGVEKVVLAEAEGGKWCANTGERERERERERKEIRLTLPRRPQQACLLSLWRRPCARSWASRNRPTW